MSRDRAWPSSRLPQRIFGAGDARSQRRLGEPPDTWVSRQVGCHRRRYPIVDARKRTAEDVATQDSVAQGSQGARLGGVVTPQLGGDEAPRFVLRRAHVGVHHKGLAQESRMTAVTVANAFFLRAGEPFAVALFEYELLLANRHLCEVAGADRATLSTQSCSHSCLSSLIWVAHPSPASPAARWPQSTSTSPYSLSVRGNICRGSSPTSPVTG